MLLNKFDSFENLFDSLFENMLFVIISLLVIFSISLSLFFWKVLYKRDREKKPHEIILPHVNGLKAIIIYQPSNKMKNVAFVDKLSKAVNEMGYEVIVNYPSKSLTYDFKDYDLIIFGGAVYMGQLSNALRQYVANLNFENKKTFVFVNGKQLDNTSELDSLAYIIPKGNDVHKIKLENSSAETLIDLIKDSIKTDQ